MKAYGFEDKVFCLLNDGRMFWCSLEDWNKNPQPEWHQLPPVGSRYLAMPGTPECCPEREGTECDVFICGRTEEEVRAELDALRKHLEECCEEPDCCEVEVPAECHAKEQGHKTLRRKLLAELLEDIVFVKQRLGVSTADALSVLKMVGGY